MLRRLLLCASMAAASTARVALEADLSPRATDGWTRGARARPDAKIELMIAVKQNVEGVLKLKDVLEKVSNPQNPSYGKYLSQANVHDLVAPSASALAAVKSHFANVALVSATPNSDLLLARVTVAQAEATLACEYYEYTHTASGLTTLRTPAYSLPTEVASHVDLVAPTVRLPPPAASRVATASAHALVEEKEKEELAPDGLFNTPKSLRALYKVGDAVGSAPSNRQAVTGFLGQKFSNRDLQKFYKKLWTPLLNTTLRTVGDETTGMFSGVEAMLDAEYATALGSGVPSEFWGFSGRAPDDPKNEPFLKWLGVVANTSDATVPKLFSTSYGEPEISVTTAYADRINVEFVKQGARGISLLFASGDSGSSCVEGKFTPNWPAASPYVTSVGGTYKSAPEQAVGLSSGGFSNRYKTPSWQKAAVATYLKGPKVPDASKFNATGRGFPDIAAQATSFLVVSDTIMQPVDGTSCASPTAAGVISLLNDIRLNKGKPPLGFLNPFLYQTAAALNDITAGSNGGCGFSDRGFYAVAGWDPVTGLGTPNFAALSKAVEALP